MRCDDHVETLTTRYEHEHMLSAQAMWIEQALGLVATGVGNNWWGLGCPSHCSGSLLLLTLCFGFGTLVGVVLTLGFFRDSLFKEPRQGPLFSPPPPASVSRPADLRLRAYLHE